MDIPARYHEAILAIGGMTGAPDSLLHVHAGLAVMLLARLVTRRSLATPVPFLVVCLAALGNEIMDRLSLGSWQTEETVFDLLNTLFWPFLLMVGLRLRRARRDVAGR